MYCTAIDRAVHTGDFISYHDVYAYSRRIEDTIDSVEVLLKEGHASEVIQLAEHALAAVESALGSIDDSDGSMVRILERFQELHLAACAKAKPDPEALATSAYSSGSYGPTGTRFPARRRGTAAFSVRRA